MEKKRVLKFHITNLRNNKSLYIITLLYFLLGIINIHLAILGFVCFLFPFILLIKNNKKTWCQGYCPRASLYSKIGIFNKSSRLIPAYIISGNMKWIILIYFTISLFIITASTLRVSAGAMSPMLIVRFLIVFPFPGHIPQLIEFTGIVPWITHLSYRIYSMMMTTTILGLLFGVIYHPRTWCAVCPIQTLSGIYINQEKKN